MCLRPGYEVISQFTTYCVNKMKKPLAIFQIDFISKLFRDTNGFKRVELIGETFNNLEKEKTNQKIVFRRESVHSMVALGTSEELPS